MIIFAIVFFVNIKNLGNTANNIANVNKANIITPTNNAVTNESENLVVSEVIEEKEITNDSFIIRKLVMNSWNRQKAKIDSEYKLGEGGEYIYDDGYTIYCESTNIQNIIFNNNYKDNVLGELTVGTTNKKIKEALGEPSFENKSLSMIGYKTSTLYAFFYENEISIYPNKELKNSKLEDLIMQYMNKTYTKSRTNFVLEIRKECPDFVGYETDEGVTLYSINRQIEINLDDNGNINLHLYNGYEMTSTLEDVYEDNTNIAKDTRDFVELKEIERKAAK